MRCRKIAGDNEKPLERAKEALKSALETVAEVCVSRHILYGLWAQSCRERAPSWLVGGP